MNIEPPQASAQWTSKGPNAVYNIFYEHLCVPPPNGHGTPHLNPPPTQGYPDAWAPCSWNLTLTLNHNTGGGESAK